MYLFSHARWPLSANGVFNDCLEWHCIHKKRLVFNAGLRVALQQKFQQRSDSAATLDRSCCLLFVPSTPCPRAAAPRTVRNGREFLQPHWENSYYFIYSEYVAGRKGPLLSFMPLIAPAVWLFEGLCISLYASESPVKAFLLSLQACNLHVVNACKLLACSEGTQAACM